MNDFEDNIKVYLKEYNLEKLVFRLGVNIRNKGFLSKEEFLTICNWKSRRPKNRYKSNLSNTIKKVTKNAFDETDEKKKIEILTELNGVQIPTASAILSVFDPNKYPIIDKRCVDALIDLELINWSHISVNSWQEYLVIMRELANRNDMTPREVDKALFAYNRIKLDKEYKNLYKTYVI